MSKANSPWGKNDKFFLQLVSEGRYLLKKGKLYSSIQRRYLTCVSETNNRYKTIEAFDKKIKKIRYIGAHRLIYLIAHGEIKRGHSINHKDGNRHNNDPNNLEAVPHSDNIQHSYDMGLQVAPKGDDHHLTKLSDADVRYIRNTYKKGQKPTQRELAAKFKVSLALVYSIINNRKRST